MGGKASKEELAAESNPASDVVDVTIGHRTPTETAPIPSPGTVQHPVPSDDAQSPGACSITSSSNQVVMEGKDLPSNQVVMEGKDPPSNQGVVEGKDPPSKGKGASIQKPSGDDIALEKNLQVQSGGASMGADTAAGTAADTTTSESRSKHSESLMNRVKISRQERRRISSELKKGKVPVLSVDNIVNALKGLAYRWKDIGRELHLPKAALDVIATDCSSDDDRLRAVVRYWTLRDPYCSWRRLIMALDWMGASEAANHLQSYTEKRADSSLTRDSLSVALETVPLGRNGLEDVLGIPLPKREELRQLHSKDGAYRRSLSNYFLGASPYTTWDSLGGELLYCEQTAAFQKVKTKATPNRDPTLTLAGLTQLLKGVSDWEWLRVYLNIPGSVYRSIRAQFSSSGDRNANLCQWYLQNHPSPSWKHVADGLYRSKDHEVLTVLRDLVPYLRGSKESRHRLSVAMKQGHVEANIGKMLIYGGCGTGKSTFMDLAVGNSPKDVRTSTPLATRPVSVFQLDVTGKKGWTRMSSKQRKEALVKITMSMVPEPDHAGPEENDSIGGGDSDEEEVVTHNEKQAKQERVPTATEGHGTEGSMTSQSRSQPMALPTAGDSGEAVLKPISTYDDLVHIIEQCSRTGEAITTYRKILLIDSGGQPQFHEILPVFLRRMSLYVFVFKLSEELDSKSAVVYYDVNGEPLGTPYQSAHTNLQLLQHCLRTLHTHRSSNKKERSSRIMIVGTHRDKEEECPTETRDQKNRKLKELLLPVFKNEVVYYDLCTEELIFPMNAKDPESRDAAVLDQIQHLVMTECIPEPVDVPLQYFALEIVLEEASLTLGRGVLSIEECLEAAAGLHFDKHTLEIALQFLDEISVVLYFPEVLEGVVFTDPQVLLDKATELVEKSYSLRDSHSKNIAGGAVWQIFKKHALFDLKFLSNDCFQKHYVAGLFTPSELVKLLNRLLIIANFNSPGTSRSMFFMPALLPVLREDELLQYCVSSESPAAALALDFPLGGPRLGVYCALCCFLVSENNPYPGAWEIETLSHSDTPAVLYRNCIRFSVSDLPGSVTLIDTFTHFQVHVSTAEDTCQELCSLARQAIVLGMKKATVTLGYASYMPSLALVCPCEVGSTHVATVRKTLWICKEDRKKCGKLGPRHLVWMDDAIQERALSFSGHTPLSEEDFPRICEKLIPFSSKWKLIGQGLGFRSTELSSIESAPLLLVTAPSSHLIAMLENWLQWAPRDARGSKGYATLRSLKSAVDRAGLGRTAQEL